MSCSACSGRRLSGRIIPIDTSKAATKNRESNTAREKGNAVRSRLRYTGR